MGFIRPNNSNIDTTILKKQINQINFELKDIAQSKYSTVEVDGVKHLGNSIDNSFINIESIKGKTEIIDGKLKSVGEEAMLENGEKRYKMEVLSIGENLCDNILQPVDIKLNDGYEYPSKVNITTVNYFKVPMDTDYYYKLYYQGNIINPVTLRWYNAKKEYLGSVRTSDAVYVRLRHIRSDANTLISDYKFMLSLSPITHYVPHQEDKIDILIAKPLSENSVINSNGLVEYSDGTTETINKIPVLNAYRNGTLSINSGEVSPVALVKYPINTSAQRDNNTQAIRDLNDFKKEQNAVNLDFDFRLTVLENK